MSPPQTKFFGRPLVTSAQVLPSLNAVPPSLPAYTAGVTFLWPTQYTSDVQFRDDEGHKISENSRRVALVSTVSTYDPRDPMPRQVLERQL